MKTSALIIILGLMVLGIKPVRVWGQNSCAYGSTQARVQRDSSLAWSQSLTVWEGESFNVGSFHNHTGQFAHDTLLRVDGPNFFSNYHNGDKVWPNKPGKYVLSVSTVGGSGGGCEEKVTVDVRPRYIEHAEEKWKNYYKRKTWHVTENWRKVSSNPDNGDTNIYRRNEWFNSDGRAEYGKGIYNRNSWWGM